MTERPILFSAPMVRAILDGRKTQTRRVVKPQPTGTSDRPRDRVHYGIPDGYEHDGETFYAWQASGWSAKSPYGSPGDRMWARETWAVDAPLDEVRRECEDVMGPSGWGHGPYFRADLVHENSGLTWRPSIFMPRWASRITLEVVNVRVERVQEISEHDAVAEGLSNDEKTKLLWLPCAEKGKAHISPVLAYRDLWNSINTKRGHGWDTKPWVWVIEFKRCI